MGIRGLSKDVIKVVGRKGSASELRNSRVGVDAAGMMLAACRFNATDIVRGRAGSLGHHDYFIRLLRPLLNTVGLQVLVLDGDSWPLKAAEQARRRTRRAEAREEADALWASGDWDAAHAKYELCVEPPAAFRAWIISTALCQRGWGVLVARFEADAELAKLMADVRFPPQPAAHMVPESWIRQDKTQAIAYSHIALR